MLDIENAPRSKVEWWMHIYSEAHRGRMALALRAHQLGYGYKQIARRMGVDIETVGRWVRDARGQDATLGSSLQRGNDRAPAGTQP